MDLRDYFHASFLCNRFDVTEFRRIRQIEIVCHQNHFFRLFHQLQAAVEYFVIVAFDINQMVFIFNSRLTCFGQKTDTEKERLHINVI